MKKYGLLSISLLLNACTQLPPPASQPDCGVWSYAIPQPSSTDLSFYDKEVEQRSHSLRLQCKQLALAGSEPVNKTVIASDDKVSARKIKLSHDIQIDVTNRWEAAALPTPLYTYFMKNRQTNAALSVAIYEQNPLLAWSDNRDALYQRVEAQLSDFAAERFEELVIHGNKVSMFEYVGKDRVAEQPLRFMAAHYRIAKQNVYLTMWSRASDYTANREEFKRILLSVQRP